MSNSIAITYFENPIIRYSFMLNDWSPFDGQMIIRIHNEPIFRSYDKIKKIVLTKEINEECVVCLEKFKKYSKVYILPCGHYFHKKCCSEWFDKKFECPLCRHSPNYDKKIDLDDEIQKHVDRYERRKMITDLMYKIKKVK